MRGVQIDLQYQLARLARIVVLSGLASTGCDSKTTTTASADTSVAHDTTSDSTVAETSAVGTDATTVATHDTMPSDTGPNATTIASLRQTPPAARSHVMLSGVVVVGVVTSSKYGHVWVQDVGGGAYSGVQLFCNYGGTNPSCTMTRDEIKALTRGQVVDVVGDYDPFTPTTPANSPTVIEISKPVITARTGTQEPVAVAVTAADIAKGALTSDRYHGVYVKTTGSYTVSSVEAAEFENANYACTNTGGTMSATAPHYFGFEVGDTVGDTIAISLGMYESEGYCLDSCFDALCTSPTTAGHMLVSAGETFTVLTGIVEPSGSAAGPYLQVMPVVDADLGH